MKKAMDETERRRVKPLAFNAEHGITPKTILKQVADVMEGAYENADDLQKVAEDEAEYLIDTMNNPSAVVKITAKLEKQMHEHAKNLEFEQAAALRDKIDRLRQQSVGIRSSAPFKHRRARNKKK